VQPSFFYTLGFWSGLFAALVMVLLAAEIGFRLGRRQGQGSLQERSAVSQLQASLLGLLALLLGFTFAMAQSRYEMRRELTVDDANAIGTTYLRARTLPEPYRGRIAGLLRQYIDVELQVYPVSDDPRRLDEVRRQARQLQQELWSQAAELAARDPSVIVGLFLSTLNDTIDLHGKRAAALMARVPLSVWRVLWFVSVVSMGLTGYGCGRGGHRSWAVVLIVALAITSVALVIVDLDRPIVGPAQISQQPLLDLRDTMR
jgi:hypothetical protein